MSCWSNKQYADWMISKRVGKSTMCLVEVEYDAKLSAYVPKDMFQISKDGLRVNERFTAFFGGWFQFLYYFDNKEGGYVIGASEPFKVENRADITIKQPR